MSKSAGEARASLARGVAARLARSLAWVLGADPRVLFWLFVPTALAVALDVALRHRTMAQSFPLREWLNYPGSSVAAAGVWAPLVWLLAALARRRDSAFARGATLALAALVVLPLTFFSYGGQAHYFGMFDAYIARDTLRLGIELRGTVGEYLKAWGTDLVPAALGACALTALFVGLARKLAAPLARARTIVPVVAFIATCASFVNDFVGTKGLQPATPDTCFLQGLVTLAWDAALGRWQPRGVSVRRPVALPPLPTPAHRPNVLLVITESVRADALCSVPSAECASSFLDASAGDRLGLARMTSQSSGTFTSCMTLWTGLSPDADLRAAHEAPMLWEIARAEGYRTAYVGAQNLRYRDLGAYLHVAGIDHLVSALDFGDAPDSHIGAPDERAADAALAWIAASEQPYFAVLHLSNTHWPYRVAPDLQPFAPHDDRPSRAPIESLRNHYRNSVLLQERTLAATIAKLRAMPRWDDTLLVFVSDHGEQFREHGSLYHLNVLFDEEVRVPSFVLGGASALGDEARASLQKWRDRRTYGQDLHATILDALGALEVRPTLPYAASVRGRSLLRPPPARAAVVSMSTTSGVWWDNDPQYGAMQDERKLIGTDVAPWACFDLRRDARERTHAPLWVCASLLEDAKRWYPNVKSP